MNLDILFRFALFGGILYQMRYFFIQYGHGSLKEAYKTDIDLESKLTKSLKHLTGDINKETKNIQETILMLRILEKKLASWHLEIQKESLAEQEKKRNLYSKYINTITTQIEDHSLQRQQIALMKQASTNTLNTIKENNPELLKSYTQKQIKLLSKMREKV